MTGRDKHAAWLNCSCQWTADLSIAGHRVYKSLGTDFTRAKREHARLMADLEHGHVPAAADLEAAVGAVADRYEAVVMESLAPNTVSGYRSQLKIIRRHLGHLDVRSIQPADLDDFEVALLRGGYAPGTVALARTVLAGVLNRAVSEGLVHDAARPTRKQTGDVDEPLAFPPQQIHAAIEVLDGVYKRLSLFTYLTGLRSGEAIAVQMEDIDGQTMHVRRNRVQTTGEVGPTKGRMRRAVDLSPHALGLLGQHADGGERLFPVGYTAWLRRWRDAAILAGLITDGDRCGLHVLRHSNVALRLLAGQPITYIARQLGHSSAAFTLRRYGRWVPSERDDPARLDALLPATSSSPAP